jgi:Fic family protein
LVNHGSYRWNPKVSFALIRKGNVKSKKLQRTQNLILSALEENQKSWNKPVGRKDLVEITGNSDATIKRELAKLLELGLIQRKGSGRATRYCLQAPKSTDRLA